MTNPSSPWVDALRWNDRWTKIESLRGGGQGEVFRVRNAVDGRIGFLKIVKSKKDPERRARFFREASAYDSFAIEGIPALLESNAHLHRDASSTPYIVTQFIEGVTLRSWRSTQTVVTLETAVSVCRQLLAILAACHAQGCVHRDVKPENIILEKAETGRLWLLDFGVSYHDLVEADFQTEVRQEVGNRFLRLPELSAGSISKQDPRSDICFAAGTLLFVLTGKHPDVLVDGDGRLPHQRPAALLALREVAGPRFARLLAVFDERFAPRLRDRFATATAMNDRITWMMQDTPADSSTDAEIAAIRELLDTQAYQRRAATVANIETGLRQVQGSFERVRQALGGSLSMGQTAWELTADRGSNTLYWTRPGSNDRILSVSYEVVPVGEEMIIRLNGEGIYRTDLSEPEWGNGLFKAVERWLLARLRQQLTDPHPLPYEADCFKETRPLATLEQAAAEAARRERPILAFVFDSERDDRSRLQWSLELFLHNRQTRDCMNTAFVTALVPLASFNDSSDYLRDQSMETARWVVLSRELKPLEQAVIYANAEEGERIMSELAVRHASGG